MGIPENIQHDLEALAKWCASIEDDHATAGSVAYFLWVLFKARDESNEIQKRRIKRYVGNFLEDPDVIPSKEMFDRFSRYICRVMRWPDGTGSA